MGFFVSGSSIRALNGVYGPRQTADELPAYLQPALAAYHNDDGNGWVLSHALTYPPTLSHALPSSEMNHLSMPLRPRLSLNSFSPSASICLLLEEDGAALLLHVAAAHI